ncbi:chorismate mutase [Nocardia sp. NPDC050710]|uniref:chorismate mutase n=1 Tax=Nocardia sp. NPDC050710 TaxID=3157220 RepID=UPI0033EFE77C
MRVLVLAVLAVALVVCSPDSVRAAPAVEFGGRGPLDRLVRLVADRLGSADAVAAAKWAEVANDGREPMIDDPEREAEVYDAMARLGSGRGLPEQWVRQVFFGQIEASKMVQRGLVVRWRFDPASAPSGPPKLAVVRPGIDRLNADIIDQLAAHRDELSAPDCMERLATSVFGLLAAGYADPLHQAALVRAVTALCLP